MKLDESKRNWTQRLIKTEAQLLLW